MVVKQFQITDISFDDLLINKVNKFIITLYGKDYNNENVACHIEGYLPHFYIKVPGNWDTSDSINLLKRVCKNLEKDFNNEIKVLKSLIRGDNHKSHNCKGKDLYNFEWNKNINKVQEFNFFKASFSNLRDMKKVVSEIKKFYNNDPKSKFNYSEKDKEWIQLDRISSAHKTCDSNLYESSIHPVIRFIHDRELNPTGWVECSIHENSIITPAIFKESDIDEFSCNWKDIRKIEDIRTSNYKIASFDIECDSLTGDFPMAKKNFKKLAGSLFDSYKKLKDIMYDWPRPETEDLDDSDEDEDMEYIEDITTNILLKSFNPDTKLKSHYDSLDIQYIKTKNNLMIHPDYIDIICKEISEISNIFTMISDPKPKVKERETLIENICKIITKNAKDKFPDTDIEILGDPIIQIGTVFHDYGTDTWYRNILVIGPEDNMKEDDICNPLDHLDIEVVRCSDEKELLLKWSELIKREDPDFITGYNIFGFDFRYIKDRVDIFFPCPKYASGKSMCRKMGNTINHHDTCPKSHFYNLGKLDQGITNHKNKMCTFKCQDLNSSALGENKLNYFTMDGRIIFDIQKEVEKGYSLDSFKLDNVASHFMRGKLKEINDNQINVDSIGHLKTGDYVSFRLHSNIGEELYLDGKKIKILDIQDKTLILEEPMEINLDDYHKIEWCLNKDDISPQDIFDKHKDTGINGAKGRAEVAKYCIQDCELCINLLLLLDLIPNNLAMANVSLVPASYIFLRGQGVRVTSVIAKKCSSRETRIPDLIKIPNLNDYVKMAKNDSPKEDIIQKIIDDSDWRKPSSWELNNWIEEIMKKDDYKIQGYEGAIVLEPKPGIYLDDPVAVLDYASLYPSSIIELNISHETLISQKLIEEMGWIKDKDYKEITYDNWIYKGKGKGDTIEKKINSEEPTITCRFLTKDFMKRHNMVQNEDPIGIIPAVLNDVLQARKDTKKRMKNEPDEFKKKVLDGLQLAYKVTANSVYGQLGAKISPVFKLELAACTTSIGRQRLTVDATEGVKKWAIASGYEVPEVVYGDTDSVFVKFSRKTKDGKLLEGKEALDHSIKCGQEAGDFIKELMDSEGKQPQVLEYEKTFWPFILISKKRYTGDKYEFEPENAKRTAMGIVLKRRDNAPIVKYVFGHVIEKIMIDKDFPATVEWLKMTLKEIREGKFPISYFVISKSLRGYYKNPQGIAHKVLADRIAERDPGNKPKANDRIPYAYIKLLDKELYDYENPYKSGSRKGQPRLRDVKQGDRIEHIDFIKENKLELDYEFYITNQIMNPVKQVLDLEMDSKETEELFKK